MFNTNHKVQSSARAPLALEERKFKEKRKQCRYKPGSVTPPKRRRLSFIYSACCQTALAFYPPSYPEGFGRTALNRWYTRTCSLQMGQPDDHPPAGGLLHHLLTLTNDNDNENENANENRRRSFSSPISYCHQ